MRTLQQIEQEEEELRAKFVEKLTALASEKKEIVSPILRERFEGKYWRYDEGTASLYSYCKKVISEYEAIFDCFQIINSENYAVVKWHTEDRFHLCETQITRAEYLEALQELKNKLEGF